MFDKLIARLEDLYPDKMVLDENEMTEFERIKLAGKVELIKEIRELIEGDSDGR